MKNDGGPAFPGKWKNMGVGVYGEGIDISERGMSMRDYFAAHEISYPPLSWVQARIGSGVKYVIDLPGVELSECLAAWRYQCAEAMLKERDK